MENDIFHCLVEERKQERQKIGGKIFPLGSSFFILPIWEENEQEKVLKDGLYTNTLNLSCIFFLSSLFPGQQHCPFFFFPNFLGLGRDSFFFFFFTGCDFFWNMFFIFIKNFG